MNVKLLCETAAKWIALVVPRSVIEIGLYRAFEPDRAGTMWQMEAQLWQVAWFFMAICIWGRWLFRSHLDRRPTIWRWWVIAFGSLYLAQFGACSPFPLISMIGKGMYMLTCTVGVSYAVAHLDKNAERADDAKNGYVMLTCISSWVIVWFSLKITSMKLGGALVTSFVQISFQMAVLKVLVPASKRCFGDEHRKLWSFKFPAMLLALELGPVLLFLGSDMTSLEFWLLLVVQESNSVLKNTGKYAKLHVNLRERLDRPVDKVALANMEEKRSIVAPCDNIAEIISPLVLLIAIGFETLYGMMFGRAPYFSETGILQAWWMGHSNDRYRGETPVMLLVVLLMRIMFCWGARSSFARTSASTKRPTTQKKSVTLPPRQQRNAGRRWLLCTTEL